MICYQTTYFNLTFSVKNMNHIKHITHPLQNVNIVIYFLSLACSVLCLPGSSVYIPPTYSTETPKPRIPGELYPRMIIMYMGKYKKNSEFVFGLSQSVKCHILHIIYK